jgi:rubrerythrin
VTGFKSTHNKKKKKEKKNEKEKGREKGRKKTVWVCVMCGVLKRTEKSQETKTEAC